MALTKPSWLRTALSYLNWDIFAWHVYVGDAVESAIDWVVEWLNEAITWALEAWNKAQAAWDKAVEVGKALWSDFLREISQVWDIIQTWWSDLGDWWSTKVTWIRDLIDAAQDWLRSLIDDIRSGLDQLGVWWDNFTRDILPSLATRFDITQAISAFMEQWKDLFEGWEAFKNSIVDFFSDPLEWLWDRFTDWFLGPEE